LLDTFASTVRSRIEAGSEPEQIVEVMNEFLFDDLGFSGNEENYYEPENSYLNRVIDRRTGNPISLCLVYMLIGRRLKMPLTGIGLPGHFICRYQTTTAEIYIDAFNHGQTLTKVDCVKYLLHMNHTLEEGHLLPVSARRMLLRICANLHQIYAQEENEELVERFQRYLVALAK
jgi:regulator of sirC expression with transglutaminase-like and TPR domain